MLANRHVGFVILVYLMVKEDPKMLDFTTGRSTEKTKSAAKDYQVIV